MTDEELAKLPRKQLEEMALAGMEIERRLQEEAYRFYQVASPKHRAFHESPKQIRIFFGGNRSGKSTAGIVELVFRACLPIHPYTRVPNRQPGHYRIFTEKYRLVESFIIPELKKWVPKKSLRGKDWSKAYDSRNNILHLCNGTTIDILTYESDVAGAASVELDGVWADEEMPERLYNETITRLISRGGRLWLTVTPMYSMTWALDFWDTVNDPVVDVFKVSIHDNPHLPDHEKKAIISQWSDHEKAARERGEFMEFSGKVYKELDSAVHFISYSKQPQNNEPVICAVDPHPRKPTVVTWAYIDPQDSVIFFDELEIAGTAKEVVQAIRLKEANHFVPTTLRLIDPAANKQVSGFGSEVTTLREFSDAGMSFSLADNNIAGYNAVHEYLRYDREKPVSALNHPQCFFTSDCPKTWYGMTHLLWDEYKFQKELRDPKEHIKDRMKDFPDCVRYTLAIHPKFYQSMAPVRLNRAYIQTPQTKSRIDDVNLAFPPLKNVYRSM